jgi:hypothetical protein
VARTSLVGTTVRGTNAVSTPIAETISAETWPGPGLEADDACPAMGLGVVTTMPGSSV